MKLLKRVNSRIVLLVGLAATQAVLVYDCWVHRNLEGFIVASLLLSPLAAAVYWIGWLVRHGVTNFEVCMVLGVGALAMVFWHDKNRVLSISVACAGLIFATILLRRLLRPIDVDQQEANLRDYRKEANSLMPITRDALNLLCFLALGVCLWAQDRFPIVPSAFVLLILPLWYASKIIYRCSHGDWTSDDENAPAEADNDRGGRA
jgi:hypothetical protein